MNSKFRYTILFLLAFTTVKAQDTTADWRLYNKKDTVMVKVDTPKFHSNKPGTTRVLTDDRIMELVKRHEMLRDTAGTISGYRVQIFFASDAGSKSEAKQIKAQFIKRFRNIPAYETYEPPNFKIRVGDFRTKLEARKALNEIEVQFPNAFIVMDQIELPKLSKLE